ncbi:polyamine aminopropyltransferase [Flammeovirga yaeyamensis]|uniref:Polyamine aminopropyltransferase n=1 Tax=Flammeovirga yaeyamensis TaxID=367791 RepID=A0AAX1N7F3_9BACT|nr:polyamine aminopropyltransferase [Flammeovirga yaeyamensis]MBB3697991.1 spermidine synthase [Flammeovirga yaeyamensis]NMF35657.1 polyamine aminopropyltransferase [Flammeovirga yaeyamensis]QWG03387.1 polyamine aminopropyltransferase [Flammeovirga yaeyamensis]
MANILSKSNTLKLALFATGLSGIVAEYVLSTLASYFLGNSVFQWTMTLSFMLFAMGLGSRFSKYIETNLLEKFIIVEFILSLLVSFSSIIAYSISAFISFTPKYTIFPLPLDGVVIYTTSICIGFLIGLEIPLATRLNDQFEALKVNISSVMEKDYFGSLFGGLFFAFVGLPLLGLTYTPFVLGFVNLLVAILLLWRLDDLLEHKWNKILKISSVLVFASIGIGMFFSNNIINYGEQKLYKDKVVFQKQTPYQRLVVTQWKDDYWLYINGHLQLSTFDEWLYHEPMAIPAMSISPIPQDILILGGGDGCLVREALKFPSVKSITLVDLDPEMTKLAKENPIFKKLNGGSLEDSKVKIINQDAFHYLEQEKQFFDVVMMDFPDPKSIELGRLQSLESFRMCNKLLRPHGVIVTQAGSPYYASEAFYCIEKTMGAAGFNTIPLHNQILTLGEWGWVLGSKSMSPDEMKSKIRHTDLSNIETKWINKEALYSITSFGKPIYEFDSTKVGINTVHNPVLPTYYSHGNWDLF